ncbi:MAG TPA: DNA gyrase modulator, partial [Ilumatobacteraceae bacterium]|nr:DNA gyrase modulator [Ilumatobacteraceae bacterium]
MTDLLIESTVLEDRLRAALPTDVDYASARLVDERTEHLSVRRNELEPVFNEFDTGVMISIWNGGGLGYAATTDLSRAGLAAAVERARYWAGVTAGAMVTTAAPTSHATGTYASPVEVTWDTLPLNDRIELLHQQSRLLGVDERIVNWGSSLVRRDVDQLLITTSNSGDAGRIEQRFRFVYPSLHATANEGTNTQTRTFGATAFCGQGGADVLGRFGFGDAAS